MFAALLTVALLPDPGAMDALQGTWLAASSVRLVMDGDKSAAMAGASPAS